MKKITDFMSSLITIIVLIVILLVGVLLGLLVWKGIAVVLGGIFN